MKSGLKEHGRAYSLRKLYHLFLLSWKIADFSAKNLLTRDGFLTSFHRSQVIQSKTQYNFEPERVVERSKEVKMWCGWAARVQKSDNLQYNMLVCWFAGMNYYFIVFYRLRTLKTLYFYFFKVCLEHQTLGQRVICPSNPATQCIILKIVGFLDT